MCRYPHITWQPCVAHVTDLFLEDVGRLDWVQPTIAQGRAVIKFVRNHHFTLSAFRGALKAGTAVPWCVNGWSAFVLCKPGNFTHSIQA
jgi:hypothetical protein